MNRIFITLLAVIVLLIPNFVLGHAGDTSAGSEDFMMGPMHGDFVDDEVHEEMEELMGRMFSGTFTSEDAERMGALMQEYHDDFNWSSVGPAAMGGGMFMQPNIFGWMSSGVGSAWMWLALLLSVVWLVLGVLGVMFLVKKLQDN